MLHHIFNRRALHLDFDHCGVIICDPDEDYYPYVVEHDYNGIHVTSLESRILRPRCRIACWRQIQRTSNFTDKDVRELIFNIPEKENTIRQFLKQCREKECLY